MLTARSDFGWTVHLKCAGKLYVLQKMIQHGLILSSSTMAACLEQMSSEHFIISYYNSTVDNIGMISLKGQLIRLPVILQGGS